MVLTRSFAVTPNTQHKSRCPRMIRHVLGQAILNTLRHFERYTAAYTLLAAPCDHIGAMRPHPELAIDVHALHQSFGSQLQDLLAAVTLETG